MESPRAWQGSRWIRWIGVALAVLLVSGALLASVMLERVARRAWQMQADNLAVVIASHASEVLTSTGILLSGIGSNLQELSAGDPAQFSAHASTHEMHRVLRRRTASLHMLEVVAIVSAEGRLLNDSRSYPTPPISVEFDRDFEYLKNHPQESRFLSAPQRGRGGKWTFYLSDRVASKNDLFLGVVTAGISCLSLQRFFDAVRLQGERLEPGQAAITLMRDDLTILARAPAGDDGVGKQFDPSGPLPAVQQRDTVIGLSKLAAWETRAGSETSTLRAVHHLDGHAALVMVAVSDSLFLADWRKQAWGLAGLTIAGLVLLMVTFGALERLLRQREGEYARTDRLRMAAEAANQAKTRFLATMSHEIRTPMNGVLGTVELISHSDSQDERNRHLATLSRSARHMMSLIDDILQLSQLEAQAVPVRREPFDAAAIAREVHRMFRDTAHTKGLSLELQVTPTDRPLLMGDAEHVGLILAHLVSNAIKFTHSGGVWIDLDVSPVQHTQTCHRLYVQVRDTGMGIDEAARLVIFGVFAQADDSAQRTAGGTGLGLPICRRLAELAGGSLNFSSAPGVGSVFSLTLELEAATHVPAGHRDMPGLAGRFAHSGAAPLPEFPPTPSAAARESHVLIVEDNPVNAMVTRAQLESLGCSCAVAPDGETALQELSTRSFDLVLLDCMLPKMSGYEVARTWRSVELKRQSPRTPMVALTADVSDSNQIECRNAGMDAFLTKPCSRATLATLMDRFADGTRTQDHRDG
ncbi:response regulator [Schlegelella sp. S2-27]|uniref:histidine kinase n=1 Tax=Caldimonas mangrovi TaxID=2944811 RepID=A0ABT0YJC3_9BURK|nr:hybrid sensor histidine kinase/response regulator [Caldimonas mangrovi]MCM5678832.1 response regulator [Caldimonas mangrovi]